ncbi:MAG: hypothetical protein R3F24_02680 [Gammaproteobacteria bacterium]
MNAHCGERLLHLLGIALLSAIALPAAATLQTIEQAYELTRNQVVLPSEPEGRLSVRPCPKCQTVVLQVTPETQWFSAPRTDMTTQEEMLAAFRAAAVQPATLIYVYYEPRTKRVKRIVLDPRPGVPQP